QGIRVGPGYRLWCMQASAIRIARSKAWREWPPSGTRELVFTLPTPSSLCYAGIQGSASFAESYASLPRNRDHERHNPANSTENLVSGYGQSCRLTWFECSLSNRCTCNYNWRTGLSLECRQLNFLE